MLTDGSVRVGVVVVLRGGLGGLLSVSMLCSGSSSFISRRASSAVVGLFVLMLFPVRLRSINRHDHGQRHQTVQVSL